MPDTPSRMSWDTYECRFLSAVKDALALRGKPPPDALVTEFEALVGYDAGKVLSALSLPPKVCPDCNALHRRALGDQCYECEELATAGKMEAAIRADERAKVLAEQKAATEAEVSADLAQKGNVKP